MKSGTKEYLKPNPTLAGRFIQIVKMNIHNAIFCISSTSSFHCYFGITEMDPMEPAITNNAYFMHCELWTSKTVKFDWLLVKFHPRKYNIIVLKNLISLMERACEIHDKK